MKVLVGASSFTSVPALAYLQEHGVELTPNPYGRRMTEDEVKAELPKYDGLLAGLEPLNKGVLECAPNLKAIARIGIGMDNVDIPAAESLGIKVSNTPDEPTQAVAEMTVAALLCIGHQIVPSNADIHAGTWKKRMGFSLNGLKVLVVGYGRIGRATAEKLAMLGCEITPYDPFIPEYAELSLEKAIKDADVVSLHASGSDEILTPEIIAGMKEGVVLLNSARGGLVNEQALYDALNSGKVSWFWGDALWSEPYDGMLTKCDNAIMTPHICTYTSTCRTQMELSAAKNIVRDLNAL